VREGGGEGGREGVNENIVALKGKERGAHAAIVTFETIRVATAFLR